jgi:protein-L-isoaspartate(D-aspartate) O-methyltransferase
MTESELAVVRRAYAKQVLFASGLADPRLEDALATLPREAFLGPGPWALMCPPDETYHRTPDADPVYLYQDVMVGLHTGKVLNNGRPSFLAFLISLCRLREGDHAVHVGAGQGYYTAVIARLVGPAGRVTAIEYEEDLAASAAANLSTFPQVEVVHGDGFTLPLAPADAILVNAGAVRPANTWLDALRDGGRLLLPLTIAQTDGRLLTRGAFFLIERSGADYHAQWKSETGIYPCMGGGRDAASEAALAAAFEKGGWDQVTRLYRTGNIEEARCWLGGPDWALAHS